MKYSMREKVVLYPGPTPWHFIYISKAKSAEIKKKFGAKQRGWSSLPVKVTLGKTSWKTSIFFERKSESYLLPVKAEVRRKEDITYGDEVKFALEILV